MQGPSNRPLFFAPLRRSGPDRLRSYQARYGRVVREAPGRFGEDRIGLHQASLGAVAGVEVDVGLDQQRVAGDCPKGVVNSPFKLTRLGAAITQQVVTPGPLNGHCGPAVSEVWSKSQIVRLNGRGGGPFGPGQHPAGFGYIHPAL